MAKKTNRRKLLAEVAAIDSDNLTSARLKSVSGLNFASSRALFVFEFGSILICNLTFFQTTIHDLFDIDSNESDCTSKETTSCEITSIDNVLANTQNVIEKSSTTLLSTFENALAAIEDETDVNAAKLAKDEALAELKEFDENIPFVANDEIGRYLDDSQTEIGEVEQTVNALLEQVRIEDFLVFRIDRAMK